MKQQRGGFAVGLIIGLLAGLALALGVALYVTKVPVPFINKVPQRSAAEDAAQAEKNRNWDPNASLQSKSAPRPAASASGTLLPAPPPAVPPQSPGVTVAPVRDGEAELASRLPPPPATPPTLPRAAAQPDADPFAYFVQAGAYSRSEEAEQQRARLAMLGFSARITEREQAGRTVYRVRIGPFEHKDEADNAKQRLGGSGIETALVRVQR